MKKLISVLLTTLLFISLPVCLCSAAVVVLPKGDADGDGKVTVSDARLVLRMAIGLEKSPAADSDYFNRLKLSSDNKEALTVSDARLILRTAIGLGTISSIYTPQELTDIFNSVSELSSSGGYINSTKMSEFILKSSTDASSDNNEMLLSPSETSLLTINENIIVPQKGVLKNIRLDSNDIKEISVSFNGKADAFDKLSELYKDDIPGRKNCTDCMIIHIELVPEKLSEIAKMPENYIPLFQKLTGYIIPPETEITYYPNELMPSPPELRYNEITVKTEIDILLKYSENFSSLVPSGAIITLSSESDYTISYSLAIPGQSPENRTENGKALETIIHTYTFDRYYK